MIEPIYERCESTALLWPDEECIDVHCVKPRGHEEEAEYDGAFVHTDGDDTWWNDRNEVEFR
jgi:hypothetical protein